MNDFTIGLGVLLLATVGGLLLALMEFYPLLAMGGVGLVVGIVWWETRGE